MRFSQTAICLALALGCAAVPCASAANIITITVTADTSSISGQSGYLDLALEPGPGGSNLVTAALYGFLTDGTLGGAATLSGDVTGQLPAGLTLDNQTTFNDYFQPITFGMALNFVVVLNGPSPLGGDPSAFNVAFYATDQTTPLLTSNPDGVAGQITVNPDGNIFSTSYAGSALSLSGSPEPAGLALIGLAMIAAFVLCKRFASVRSA